MKLKLSSLLLVALLTGCGVLGLQPPGDFNGRAGYGTAMATGALDTVAQEVTASRMSSEDGRALINIAENSKGLVDSARRVVAGDPTAAGRKLDLATNILEEIREYLDKE